MLSRCEIHGRGLRAGRICKSPRIEARFCFHRADQQLIVPTATVRFARRKAKESSRSLGAEMAKSGV